MYKITMIFACLGLLVAGLFGTTLSVPLQAPAVILLGFAAVASSVYWMKSCQTVIQSKGLFYLAVLTAVYFIVRAAFSPVWDLGVEDLMLILPATAFYFLAGYSSAGVKMSQAFVGVVITLLLLHLGSGILQLAGGDGYSLSMILSSSSRATDARVTGMYGYYGSFANFAVIAGLLCASLGIWGRLHYVMRISLVLLGILAFCLAIWSQSRSAVLSLVVAFGVFLVLVFISLTRQRSAVLQRGKLLIAVFGLGALALCVAGGIWVFQNRTHDDRLSGADIAFDSGVRLPYWSMAAEQWADHPITGAGSRSYSYGVYQYWSPNLNSGEANPEFVHNEYLQLLADYGFVGFILMIALLAWHVTVGVKRIWLLSAKVSQGEAGPESNARALVLAGTCGMVAMAVHVIFDFRTHLLANLLLLVCCAVWILPVANVQKLVIKGVSKQRIQSAIMAVLLLFFGAGAVWLGSHQLWAGWPLLESRIAKEDGAWFPLKVDERVWIPALEESVARASHWRRYQKLGTLYRIEAKKKTGETQDVILEKAKRAYWASVDRHPYNPITRINLASIYTEQSQWNDADELFASAAEMAKGRENWFRMHSQWALMHQKWGVDLWKKNDILAAGQHFLRAKELFLVSYDNANFKLNKRWGVEYTQLLVVFARFLDSQGKYSEADSLYGEAHRQVNWYNWQTETKLKYYYALHLYEKGMHLWHQRKPYEAYALMLEAKKSLGNYRSAVDGDIDEQWHNLMGKIQHVIRFLKQTGTHVERKNAEY